MLKRFSRLRKHSICVFRQACPDPGRRARPEPSRKGHASTGSARTENPAYSMATPFVLRLLEVCGEYVEPDKRMVSPQSVRGLMPLPLHMITWLSCCLLFLLALSVPELLQAQDIAQIKKGVVKITAQVDGKQRVGSGVIVKVEEGQVYIVTASHVIEGDPQPNVHFYAAPHRPIRARVLGLEGGDPAGLAALLVEGKIPADLVALPLDQTAAVSGGEHITLIGFPRAEGSMWTVTTGTLSGRKGTALAFAGTADEGNSGGPVLLEGKVVGIVTQVGAKFNTAVPAMVARFALEGWGVRLSESPSPLSSDEEEQPVKPSRPAPAMTGLSVAGDYQGIGFFSIGGMVGLQTRYQQKGDTVSGSYADNQGDFGSMQGTVQGRVFKGHTVSQAFQGVRCEFVSEVEDGGATIQGTVTCNNGNSGTFALERQ